jgi:hypothetical protein
VKSCSSVLVSPIVTG